MNSDGIEGYSSKLSKRSRHLKTRWKFVVWVEFVFPVLAFIHARQVIPVPTKAIHLGFKK